MDDTADASRLPVDLEGSLDPGQLPEVTLGNHSMLASGEPSTPMVMKSNSGRMSPVRSRTMKEYDQQISDLMKENFNLKMRIYYMEERMQQRFGDGQDVFKTNIELQVEVGNLKKELLDKQVLVQKAALAMETLTAKQEQAEESLRGRLMADCRTDMDRLREDLRSTQQKCEHYQDQVSDMEKKIETFKKDLNNAREELADTKKEREALGNKVERAEFDVQTLTGQLKLSEQGKREKEKELATLGQQLKDLQDQLSDALKKSSRKDRDIQDELEDQKEALKRRDSRVSQLEDMVRDKDDKIGELEDSLKDLQEKKEDADRALEVKDNELKHKTKLLGRYMKGVEDLVLNVHQLETECGSLKGKLRDAEQERDTLQEALKAAELQRTQDLIKSLGKKEGELAGFQDQLAKAMEAMNKSEEAVEALQAQLKAERADFDQKLRDQAMHFQISIDNRTEPNSDLDLLKKQIADLQKLIADQNVDLVALAREKGGMEEKLKDKAADLESLTSQHNKEMASLERELTSLRAEVNSKDIKIQALENHRVWVEQQQRETVYRFRDNWSNDGGLSVQDFSLDLLQDIKMMMDVLRREISSLAKLRQFMGSPDTAGDGLSAEVLLTEISSVQRIYNQLERGVEKNHQLHQALLNSLRGEHRQSDSPDSNSCQDGGYNLTSPTHQVKTTYTVQAASGTDVASATTPTESGSLSSLESDQNNLLRNPRLDDKALPLGVDRSLQTGTSFSHVDQWVQTSLQAGDESKGHQPQENDRKRTSNLRPEGQKKSAAQGRQVSFQDVGDDSVHYYAVNHNDSLTDDAKGDLGQYAESLEDYYNFRQGVLFDEDHFEDRRHDRASSVKLDSRSVSSAGRATDSESSTPVSGSTPSPEGNGGRLPNSGITAKHTDPLITQEPPSSHKPTPLRDSFNRLPVNGSSDFDESDGNGHIHNTGTNVLLSRDANISPGDNASKPSIGDIQVSGLPSDRSQDSGALRSIGEGGDCGEATQVKTPVSSASSPGHNKDSSSLDNSRRGRQGVDIGQPVGGGQPEAWTSKHPPQDQDTGDWPEDQEGRRARRNSWAEELEQYRVHNKLGDHSKGGENPADQVPKRLQPCDNQSHPATDQQTSQQGKPGHLSQADTDTSPFTANMSAVELREVVAQLQMDFIESRKQNRVLQQQLEALKGTAMNGGAEYGEGDSKLVTNGHRCWTGTGQPQSRRSHIPRLVSSNSCHSSTSSTSVGGESTASEGSDGGVAPLFGHHTNPPPRRQHQGGAVVTHADRDGMSLSNLSQGIAQIKMLERKLQATENTVRLLSKKNKAYLSALEAAGLSTSLMKRSNSETSLTTADHSISQRASSMGNLSALGVRRENSPSRLSHLISPQRDITSRNMSIYRDTVESMEKARSQVSDSWSRTGEDNCYSQPIFLTATPSTTNVSSSPESKTRFSEFSVSVSNGSPPSQQPNYSVRNNLSSPAKKQNNNHNNSLTEQLLANGSPHAQSITTRNIPTTSSSPEKSSYTITSASSGQSTSQAHTAGAGKQGRDKDQCQGAGRLSMGTSMFDQSVYTSDITYSSMMDNTMMNRLLTNLDHTMPNNRESLSNLSVNQLQSRVEHLERLNQALRQEVGVYEALEQSQGTQVSPSLSHESVGTGGNQGSALTEDDLLRMHLMEIRKLRERLEKLDVTKDPEQLLIFQSHTYQRIVRQETVINQLREEMQVKEEQWHREMAELRHRLSRERALLVEKLELDIADLQKSIKTQTVTIGEQEDQINDLKRQLDLKEEKERQKEEELEKVVAEKDTLEADFMDSERKCATLEKTVRNLETERRNYEVEYKRATNELKDLEKETEALKNSNKELEEGSKCLKEIVAKRERTLQEKVYVLKKVTGEKTALESQLRDGEDYTRRLENELDKVKKEFHETKMELRDKVGLQAEVEKIQNNLRQEKTKYEYHIQQLTEEKTSIRTQLEADSRAKAELHKQIEKLSQEVAEKASLERQIVSLRSEVKQISTLEDEIHRLKASLNRKATEVSELRQEVASLSETHYEVSRLREELNLAQEEIDKLKNELQQWEESGKDKDEEKKTLAEKLKEREAKLKKREKQLSTLCKKSDTVLVKLNYSLKEKEEQIKSLKRQKHLYEITLSCSSQEQKDQTMKELLEELLATRRQVDHLLSKLEENSAFQKPHAEGAETYTYSRTTHTTDRTTTWAASTDGSHDQPQTTPQGRHRDDSTESLFDEIGRISNELDPELRPQQLGLNMRPASERVSVLSEHADQGSSPSNSPSKRQHYDSNTSLSKGVPTVQAGLAADIQGLCAVLKLQAYEKLRTEAGQSLVILSGVEARIADRLRSYKAKSVTESMDYSTLREISMSSHNLRVCLEEATRIVAGAWILELPPVDACGHFFDPALVEQNENLKREVTRLQSRNDMLDHTVKEQQGRLSATEIRQKQWEASLYKQLTKSTQDLEHAKENIDSSLYSLPQPQKHHSFRHPSPRKSPRKRYDDTI